MEGRQVKSKKRVADHGEVFTNEREVKAMVDLVWKELEKGTADNSYRYFFRAVLWFGQLSYRDFTEKNSLAEKDQEKQI